MFAVAAANSRRQETNTSPKITRNIMRYQDEQFSPDNNPGPGARVGPFVDPQQLARLVMAARAAQQAGQGAGTSPVNSPGPVAGTGNFVDPQQLAQLVRAARAAQQVRQGASTGRQSAPAQALPISVLGPTSPFAAGVGPELPSAPAPYPDPAKAAAIQRLRQAWANPPESQTPRNGASFKNQVASGPVPGGSNTIVDLGALTRARSRIPRPDAVPHLEPNLGIPNRRTSDPKRARTTLDALTRGADGQAMEPLGVSPSGSLMRDARQWMKAPSRIPKPPVDGLIFGDKVSPEFLTKVDQISSDLGIDPNWLMAVMAFESGGTFSPSEPNHSGSSGVGLIQFTKSTGYDLEKLKKMTGEDQLDYVAKYLQAHKGKLGSLSDLYMSVLWPDAIGKPDDHVLFKSPSIAYKQNRGLDVDDKGAVTKADAAAAVERKYQEGVRRGTTTLRLDGSTESRVGTKTIVRSPKHPRVIGKI